MVHGDSSLIKMSSFQTFTATYIHTQIKHNLVIVKPVRRWNISDLLNDLSRPQWMNRWFQCCVTSWKKWTNKIKCKRVCKGQSCYAETSRLEHLKHGSAVFSICQKMFWEAQVGGCLRFLDACGPVAAQSPNLEECRSLLLTVWCQMPLHTFRAFLECVTQRHGVGLSTKGTPIHYWAGDCNILAHHYFHWYFG